MYTQNTAVHIKLWHKNFVMLAVVSMMTGLAANMFIPVIPLWMTSVLHMSTAETAAVFTAYVAGLFAPGAFCSYLVQRFRRNIVCLLAIVAMIVTLVGLPYVEGFMRQYFHNDVTMGFLMVRVLLGLTFGLSQMILSGTLIIDACQSFLRTEANHSSAWLYRFTFSLGPIAGLFVYQFWGFEAVALVAVVVSAMAAIVLLNVEFPFKAPEENLRLMSLDRFFLPQGKWLFVNLVLLMFAVGLTFSGRYSLTFYGFMMTGFLLALLAQKFVFVQADLKSEVITGGLLVISSMLLLLTRGNMELTSFVAPVNIGIGMGIIGARFLLFFLKLSSHCQRGTAQTTYFLATETGLTLGIAVGLMLRQTDIRMTVALVVVCVALLMYHFFTHSWYMRHKNR